MLADRPKIHGHRACVGSMAAKTVNLAAIFWRWR